MSSTDNQGLQHLLDGNQQWDTAMRDQDPEFFQKLVAQQTPESLDWLRRQPVPATQLVGLLPGDMFVHRNVANVVIHTDLNCLSVLHFAVHCRSSHHRLRPLWLRRRAGGAPESQTGLDRQLAAPCAGCAPSASGLLAALPTDEARLQRLCDLNVIEQVVNVCQTTIVQQAWERGQPLTVHGWIYAISSGLVQALPLRVSGIDELPQAYPTAIRDIWRRALPRRTV